MKSHILELQERNAELQRSLGTALRSLGRRTAEKLRLQHRVEVLEEEIETMRRIRHGRAG